MLNLFRTSDIQFNFIAIKQLECVHGIFELSNSILFYFTAVIAAAKRASLSDPEYFSQILWGSPSAAAQHDRLIARAKKIYSAMNYSLCTE